MNDPRPESRITSLEARASKLEAGIGELSSDTAEELRAIRQEIKQGHLDIGKAIDAHGNALMQEIHGVNMRLDYVERRIGDVEQEVSAFKTDTNKRFDRVDEKLDQILQFVHKQEEGE